MELTLRQGEKRVAKNLLIPLFRIHFTFMAQSMHRDRSRFWCGRAKPVIFVLLTCYDISQILLQNTTYIKGSVVLCRSCVLLSNETTCNSTNFNAGLVYVERTLDRRHDTAVLLSAVTQRQGVNLVLRVFGYAIQDGGRLGPGGRERGKGYSL